MTAVYREPHTRTGASPDARFMSHRRYGPCERPRSRGPTAFNASDLETGVKVRERSHFVHHHTSMPRIANSPHCLADDRYFIHSPNTFHESAFTHAPLPPSLQHVIFFTRNSMPFQMHTGTLKLQHEVQINRLKSGRTPNMNSAAVPRTRRMTDQHHTYQPQHKIGEHESSTHAPLPATPPGPRPLRDDRLARTMSNALPLITTCAGLSRLRLQQTA